MENTNEVMVTEAISPVEYLEKVPGVSIDYQEVDEIIILINKKSQDGHGTSFLIWAHTFREFDENNLSIAFSAFKQKGWDIKRSKEQHPDDLVWYPCYQFSVDEVIIRK